MVGNGDATPYLVRVNEIIVSEINEYLKLEEVEYVLYLKKIEGEFYIYYDFKIDCVEDENCYLNPRMLGYYSTQGDEFFRENTRTFEKIYPWDTSFHPVDNVGWIWCYPNSEGCVEFYE